jgi:hypothetical protein
MVGSIKNRIAAFENLAEQSKSNSKLLAIVPPKPGFSASKKIVTAVKAKETYGHVPFEPLKSKSSNIQNDNVAATDQTKSYLKPREYKNEPFMSDISTLEQYKNIRETKDTQVNIPADDHGNALISKEIPKEADKSDPAVLPEAGPLCLPGKETESTVRTNAISPPNLLEGGRDSGIINPESLLPSSNTTENDALADMMHPEPQHPLSREDNSNRFREAGTPPNPESPTASSNTTENDALADMMHPEPQHPLSREDNSNRFRVDDVDSYYNSTNGPFPIISVKSKDGSRSHGLPDERDEESISPLSFLDYKISSKRDNAPSLSENNVMNIPAVEEETEFQIGGLAVGNNEEISKPVHNPSNKTRRMNLPDIELEEEEGEGGVQEHLSNDESADLISFSSHNGGANESDSFGEADKNKNIGGLRSVQEEYDNFTLGSGESGTFFLTKDLQVDEEPWRENFEESVKHEIALSAHPTVYEHRTEGQNRSEETIDSRRLESQPRQGAGPHDPLFLDDSTDGSVSNSSRKSEGNSFEEYVNNMRPVTSIDEDEKVQDLDAIVQDEDERVHAENLIKNIDNHSLSEEKHNLSLYDEDKVLLSDHDMKALGFEEDTLNHGIDARTSDLQVEAGRQNDTSLDSHHDILDHDIKLGDNSDRSEVPFDEAENNAEDSPDLGHEMTRVDQAEPLHLADRSLGDKSPVYYPEEDFVEDDYADECYDEETVDDETGDLLGIDFDELSMASEGQQSHFVNEQKATLYPMEYFVHSSDNEDAPVNYMADASKQTIHSNDTNFSAKNDGHTQLPRKSQYQDQQPHVPLASVHEDQPPDFSNLKQEKEDFGRTSSQYYSSDPLVMIRNGSNLSNTDEVSQMTDSTYDLEQRLHLIRSNQADQDRSAQGSKSDRSSLMTYSIAEHASATSIVQNTKNQDVPIFREKNSLRDNPKLNRRNSTLSELTDPVSGFGRQNTNDGNFSTLSTISGLTPTKPQHEKKKTPARKRSPSPSVRRMGRQGHESPIGGGRGRERQPQKKPSSKSQKGRRQDTNMSKRRFSWRSLSPFRRRSSRSSRSNKINEKNSTLFENSTQFDQDELRGITGLTHERPKLKRDISGGSTPSIILAEEEAMETSIPLVAVTLSDDSSRNKMTQKKKFSLRSLSPFGRGRSKRRSKKAGRADPFDESETSL